MVRLVGAILLAEPTSLILVREREGEKQERE